MFLSIRDGARLLNVGKSTIAEAYIDLADRGFIKPNAASSFDFKTGASVGRATTWILTEDSSTVLVRPTREFQHWRPKAESKRIPEIISRSVLEDGSYPRADMLYPRTDKPRQTVPEHGQLEVN